MKSSCYLTREKMKAFTDALKRTYQKQYEAVCPIPYMRDKLRSVNSVFINSGIQERSKENKRNHTWERLPSYYSIFKGRKGSRCFIQGDPGFGKSTLCLQLAYDWCNRLEDSPLYNVQILIVLRLRQFGIQTSLWKAIKLFLVPLQSISVTDIESVIIGCSSVKIILDGYDEYLGNDGLDNSPIDMIIRKQELPNIDVIVTSRYIPKDLPTESQIFRLTGFNARAREEYIKKAIVNDDNELMAIKDQLQGNDLLTKFCLIPLIFVMFAHVAHEKQYYFRDFMSVTGIFRFLISCFHDHLRNKLSDANVKNLYRFENEHTALDQLAFNGLAQHGHSMAWTTTEMLEELSKDFYDRYVTLGILVPEETALDSADSKTNLTTKIRFYHNIFSEWYAAHYLAFQASKPEVTLSTDESQGSAEGSKTCLSAIDPSNYQYVYRFACGLRPESEDKITNYLERIGHGELARLCRLENSRKRKHDAHDENHEKKAKKRQRDENSFCSIL